jgi:hypothetical protein
VHFPWWAQNLARFFGELDTSVMWGRILSASSARARQSG